MESKGDKAKERGGESQNRRREKKKRKEEKRKERRKKGKEEGNRNQCLAGRKTGQQRIRNCATRGRFPSTPVILSLGAT